jgi:hypothetical protein
MKPVVSKLVSELFRNSRKAIGNGKEARSLSAYCEQNARQTRERRNHKRVHDHSGFCEAGSHPRPDRSGAEAGPEAHDSGQRQGQSFACDQAGSSLLGQKVVSVNYVCATRSQTVEFFTIRLLLAWIG